MNLNKVEKELKNRLNNALNLSFEYEYVDDYLKIFCELSSNSYKGLIYTEFKCYNDGTLLCSFIFDKVVPTYEVFIQLEEFNENSVWLTAYISDKNYLCLRNNLFVCSEKGFIENIDFLLDHLVSDRIKKYLVPIVDKTYAD